MKRNRLIVALVFLIFFVISFLTNILGPLVPDIINSFSLSLTLAGFLPFSFFVAYGVMSIPAGMLVERYREKRIMLWAFLVALAGALLFAILPRFSVALPSLFLIGIGMAMLQVTINPLLRVAGGEEHFAFNSVFAQLVFGLASFLSPKVFSYLVLNLPETSGRGGPFLEILRNVVPEQYRLWLEEEVVYIITDTERDVFRKLETDKERDIFIEAFWKHRDPTPGTPANEFKDEHYKRKKYANEYFGRGTPRPGWMTDMGRIYIVLGPPRNSEDHDNINGVYPVRIWTYDGDPDYGLPSAFNIIFFKKHGTGEYVLYSPVDDGPESLIADWGTGLTAEYMQDSRNAQSALQQLAKLAPNLAYQTLSLIPGERVMSGSVSLASTRLIGNVLAYPQKKVEDTYAEALLKYKDVIEVDYSANYIASDSSLHVIKDESGHFMVHYSVEPKKISVGSYGDKYSTNYELDGRISDADGNTVFQYMKELPLSFSGPELQDLGAKSLAIQDLFPLVPGTYKFDLLLKNTVSKEFTTFEGTISIPEESASPVISSLVLGYRLEKSASPAGEFIPFRIKEGQLLTPARKTFTQKENLVVFFQVL